MEANWLVVNRTLDTLGLEFTYLIMTFTYLYQADGMCSCHCEIPAGICWLRLMPMSASQKPSALWSTEMSDTEKQEKLHLYLQKCAADEGLTVEEIPNSPLTTPHSPGRCHSSGSQGQKERPKRFEELVAHARSRICVWIAKTSAERAKTTGEKGAASNSRISVAKPTIRKSAKESAQSTIPSEELAECLPGSVEEPEEPKQEEFPQPIKDEKEEQNSCICLQHFAKSEVSEFALWTPVVYLQKYQVCPVMNCLSRFSCTVGLQEDSYGSPKLLFWGGFSDTKQLETWNSSLTLLLQWPIRRDIVW